METKNKLCRNCIHCAEYQEPGKIYEPLLSCRLTGRRCEAERKDPAGKCGIDARFYTDIDMFSQPRTDKEIGILWLVFVIAVLIITLIAYFITR